MHLLPGHAGFYRVLKLLGMDPGLEFKVAMQEAEAQGARLVYGDADVQQTLRNLSATIKMEVCAQSASRMPLAGGRTCCTPQGTFPATSAIWYLPWMPAWMPGPQHARCDCGCLMHRPLRSALKTFTAVLVCGLPTGCGAHGAERLKGRAPGAAAAAWRREDGLC